MLVDIKIQHMLYCVKFGAQNSISIREEFLDLRLNFSINTWHSIEDAFMIFKIKKISDWFKKLTNNNICLKKIKF